jgi:purine-binding chemotaxis protein CheW
MAIIVRGKGEARAAARRAGELGKRTEYLAFSLAHDTFAIPLAVVAEILDLRPITGVPRAPRNVLGVVSVRGRLITVIDGRRRMALPESAPDRRTRILLLRAASDELIGLLVDEVLQVYRLADDQIEPATALGGEQASHIAGIGRQDGALLILLDALALVGGE